MDPSTSTRCEGLESVNVVLICSETGESENGSLIFSSPPLVAKDIKIAVEEEFSIPMFAQTLSFDSQSLADNAELIYTRVRSGDTFHIEFTSKANCAELKKIIEWLDQLIAGFRNEKSSTSTNDEMSKELNLLVTFGLVSNHLQHLINLFSGSCPQAVSNRGYFHNRNGTEKLVEVYRAILKNTWEETAYSIKLMEGNMLIAIANLSNDGATFAMRNYFTEVGAVELMTRSLLRVRVNEGELIVDGSAPRSQRNLLINMLETAAGVLSK